MDGGFNSVTTKTATEVTRNQTGGNAAGALASNRLFFRGTEKIGDLTAGFHYELGLDAQVQNTCSFELLNFQLCLSGTAIVNLRYRYRRVAVRRGHHLNAVEALQLHQRRPQHLRNCDKPKQNGCRRLCLLCEARA